jgi:serine/threonine protein phosphatase PrpC
MQSAGKLPAVDSGQRSDPGRDPDKQVNEDACGRWETRFGHLCVVCDGMGGHAAGREAAELAVSTVVEEFARAADGTAPADVLRAAIEEANRRVHVLRTSEIGLGRPGCTVVATLTHSGGTEVAHVGDSRAYLVHGGQISRLTHDHSIVQQLVDRGLLTPEQSVHHPDANRITRALGIGPDTDVEVRPRPVAHVTGDAFILCSDGLSDLVEDFEILGIVGDEPAAQAVGKLVDLANARGGHDNITVLVLRVQESAGLPHSTDIARTVAQTRTTFPSELAPAETSAQQAPDSPERNNPVPRRPRSRLLGRWPRRVVMAILVLASLAVVLLGGVAFYRLHERLGHSHRVVQP